MKKMINKNLAMLIVGVTLATIVSAQPPEGFNYQAVVRNGDGEPIANQQVGLRITLQSEDATTVHYSESHLVTTSPQGVVSIIVGDGEVVDGTFAYIPWGSADIFMKVEVDAAGGTDYSELGTTRLQSVPYALFAPNTSGASLYGSGEAGKVALWTGESSLTSLEALGFDKNLEVVSSAEANDEDPIFVVRNREGQIVFGVYQTGVRVYVDSEESKGSKGGFAVGGLTQSKEGEIEYFRVTPDSTRVYVDMSSPTKAGKGGFAVGGLTQSKALPTDLLYISADSARIYIDNDAGAKTGSKGGFAVGGLTQGKLGVQEDYLMVTRDSSRVYVNTDSKTGSKGGFAVGGLTQGKVDPHNFMLLTPENYLIGQEAGASLTTGVYNSFLGYQAGRSTTDGVSNIFLGYKSGFSNIGNSADSLGSLNLFAGNESGYSNTTGYENVFLGNRSGYSNLGGYRNVFIGVQSGETNTIGNYNVFLGNQSGQKNTSGESNVFLGTSAGLSNTEGSLNVMIGDGAGWSNTIGENNVFIGYASGYSNDIGINNIFLGSRAGYSTT
ncbi:MAG TPA: hypothetical protein P5200_11880, partial [Tenuifilaceae bacterium]|nr:hypothetical protein [Tenuifilaceae bacterium]HRX69064.1 hypothetical protein [Tenuifilaceae bacterium]